MEDRTFEENLVNDGMAQADAKVTEAEEERHDGQIKCPKCGATDIELNPKTGKLRCNFCRHIFEPEFTEDDGNISELEGVKLSKGASDIAADARML